MLLPLLIILANLFWSIQFGLYPPQTSSDKVALCLL